MDALAGKRVLVTGANGFIGSNVVKTLQHYGADVHSLNIQEWNLAAITREVTDICPDYVLHLRGQIGKTDQTPESFFQINYHDTKILVEALQVWGKLQQFVHVGTIAEYGSGQAPFQEDAMSGEPVADYGKSKLAATLWLKDKAQKEQFPVVIVRLSVVYGPGQKPHTYLIPNVIMSALQKKDFHFATPALQTRDPLFVSDAAEGIVAALRTPEAQGEIINLGLGVEYPVKTIAEMITTMLGNPITIQTGNQPDRSGESLHYWQSITKAGKILQWQPTHTLEAGLQKTITWYKENFNSNLYGSTK